MHYFDYEIYDVDLFLIKKNGILSRYIDKRVNILELEYEEDYFNSYIEAVKKIAGKRKWPLVLRRTFNLLLSFADKGLGAVFMSRQLPVIEKCYDVCIDYNGQYLNYYMIDNVKAKKKITYFHSDYSKWDYYRKADKKYYRHADYIVSVSEECVNSLKKYFPEYAGKVICIENIITRETIDMFNTVLDEHGDLLDIPDGKKILVTIGRACEDKGTDLAIMAAEKIRSKIGDGFLWLWVGPGETSEKYVNMIESAGIGDCFHMLGGKENPYPYMERADIIVHPSRFEGKAVAVEEALVFHKPVVATNYSTVNNQILDKKTGLIVDMNAESIAEGILSCLGDAILCRQMTEYQNAICVGNADEIEKLYRLFEGDRVEGDKG